MGCDKHENNPELDKIQKEKNHSQMNIITIGEDKLPH